MFSLPKWAIVVAIITVILLMFFGAMGYSVGVLNTETRLHNLIDAKQRDNESAYDNMWKKISQVAQVTNAQKDALREIFVEHAAARGSSGGSLAKWINESVPNVDTTTFNNLQNIIVSSRDKWTFNQKELLDYSREHNNLIGTIPSSLICSAFGRGKIDVTIITSARAKESMKTGEDNDTNVFELPAEK